MLVVLVVNVCVLVLESLVCMRVLVALSEHDPGRQRRQNDRRDQAPA